MSAPPLRLPLLTLPLFGVLALAGPGAPQPPAPPEPLTVAERTGYRATSRHADVMAFCQELAKKSQRVHLMELGKSLKGLPLPLMVVADPPLESPEAAARSGKQVILAIGNIHAGEVDGKEALMMLARDLATAPSEPLLKDLVFVIVPLFNADGNELIARTHRTEQNGPVEGVGVRENAAGLDLNRDFVKLESPEVRALVRAFNRWHPAVFIDMHTTDGSVHGYALTYDGPRHPSTNPALLKAVRDRLLPEVGVDMLKKDDYPTFFYGNFSRDHKSWEMYPAQPRFGMQYVGLRGRVGILSESYTYAPFRDRVLAGRAFVRHISEWTAGHAKELKDLLKQAETPQDKVVIRGRNSPLPGDWKVRGYAIEKRDGRDVLTGKPVEYPVTFYGQVEPLLTVTRPYAYLVPPQYRAAIETLQRHGFQMEELREDVQLDTETYRMDRIRRQDNRYLGPSVLIDTTVRKTPQMVKAGSVIIKTAQPLGTLAVLFLEPGTEDGLVTWKFFDEGLAEGKDFPVLRLIEKPAVVTGKPRDLPEDRKHDLPPPEFANFGASPVTIQGWLDDEHYLQTRDGRLMKVEARTGRATPYRHADPDKLAESLAAVKGIDKDTARRLTRGPDYRFDPKKTWVLIHHDGDLYQAHVDGSPGAKLTKSHGAREYLTFSPDGQHLAWVRGNNLWSLDVTTQTEHQLTKDGAARVFNGKGDWVYGEEIFDRRAWAYWWSPDSQRLAFFHIDDAPVPQFRLQDLTAVQPREEMTDYPKAGDPNPLAKLGVVGVGGGDIVYPETGEYKPGDVLLIRAGFTPDSKKVYVYFTNRTQTWLDVCTAPVDGGTLTRLLRETTKAWIDDPGELHFLPDGTFLFASERTGWKHFYHYDPAGQLLRPVTQGDWEVKALSLYDKKNGWLYFTGTKDAPLGQNLYRCRLDGSGFQRLSQGPGDHRVSVSPTGSYFIDTHSDPQTPPQVHLVACDGEPVRTLDSNPAYEREQYRTGLFERVHIPTKDGFVLEGTVTKPADFDPKKRYPVWVQIYGGPRMPTVHDSYGGRGDGRTAAQGFIVFHVDPRSGSGKGACSAWAAFKQLGVQETKDLDEAVDWLCRTVPQADPKRVGISGHSYGGYLTAYVLTHSTKFAAGAAGAPVTDWRNYDTIYTERYMLTPQENAEGYDKSSVVKAARNLHGKLLLMHGLMDDNVHATNTVQLIDALQRAGKDYELLIFPRARHGFGAQRQILDFMKRTLGGPE